jgi:P27 family predicted phage terminase small subunit
MRGLKPQLKAIEGGLISFPKSPSWLPPEAKAEWRRVIPGLSARRTVTKEDLTVLESYCLAVGLVRSATATLAREGETLPTKAGGEKRHPAYQTLFQAMTESRRLAAELGLTPASRNKAPVTEAADDLSSLDL